MGAKKLRVLVLCDFQGSGANVASDFLYSFNRYSRHEYFYLHAWRRKQCQRLHNFDFDRFDVIVLFWDCLWLDVDNKGSRFFVPPWVIERIKQSRALKVQFLQDEYRDVRKMNAIMARFGINVMFTCVADADHEACYPRKLIPTLQEVRTVLTGYVPTYLERIRHPFEQPRAVDIGYRSRANAFWLGRLAQEKVQIATEFTRIGRQYGFTTDISVREEDRIYGQHWLEFLKASRFSLGTESGASVIDFDGTIRAQTDRYLAEHPDATFEDVQRRFFADAEGKFAIQTISPRIFEAAAFHNTLVLHEGQYAGILQPDVHFISVKKDYSNEAEVVARMRDTSFCRRLAEQAHADLIQSGAYSYRTFVRKFDAIIDKHRPTAAGTGSLRATFYLANYLHGDTLLPRGDRFVTLPPHPFGRWFDSGVDKMQQFCCAAASLGLVFRLLAANPSLRNRILDAVKSGEVSLSQAIGLAKELRYLGILSLACNDETGTTPYRIQAEYDPRDGRLQFRSVRGETKRDVRTVVASAFAAGVHSIGWDHSEVGEALPLPWDDRRYFDIHLGDTPLITFDRLHALFENCEDREREYFEKAVSEPMATTWGARVRTMTALGAALAIRILWRMPLNLLARAAQKLAPQNADRKSEAPVP